MDKKNLDIIETNAQIYAMSDAAPDRDILYSMRVVTRMTGLNADTIRAWERRYGAVTPRRTEGNTRKYAAGDVRRLSLLKEATRLGYRIGDVAGLSEPELAALVKDGGAAADAAGVEARVRTGAAFEQIKDDYLEAVSEFDSRAAERLLTRSAALLDPRDFVLEILLPIVRETGDLWEAGAFTIAHEHLVSMQARNLLSTILRFASPLAGAPRIITATPEGHRHEFGALAAALLAGLRGLDVLYLGPEVPERDLMAASKLGGVGLVILSVILRSGDAKKTKELGQSMERLATEVETWVGLDEGHPLTKHLRRARTLHRFEDLDLALTRVLA